MKNALIAVLVDVELEAFQFYAPLIGDVFDVKGGKVGKSRLRADAGKFWAVELYGVAPMKGSISKTF